MAALPPSARMRRTQQNTQYTFSLDRRIHHVKAYPVRTVQGASVLIYGHENGITVIWRGGQRLKPLKPKAEEKPNGTTSDDAVMIVDSDDEDVPAKGSAHFNFVDKAEFEANSSADSSELPEIIQTLDLRLGTPVLHVAVLPMSDCSADDADWGHPEILKEKMVFAVACATTNYLVTLPLTPPSHESKARPELRNDLLAGAAGRGLWGETLTELRRSSRPCEGIAMALAKQQTDMSAYRDRHVVVVAHSREARATMRFWDVPLDAKLEHASSVVPFQTENMRHAPTAVAFNPSQPTQLLVLHSQQAVRIFDYAVSSMPVDDTFEGPHPPQGSWLMSLYAPFTCGSMAARKPVVGASWICNGRAILALLADGQWGIWDIDGASPGTKGTSATSSIFGKHLGGLRGSAMTAFNASGYLEGTGPLWNPASQKSTTPAASGEFVPMTPHTRREVSLTSFGGLDRLTGVRGGVEVTPLPMGRGPGDEAAVLWLGGADTVVAVIPGVARFWKAQLLRSNGGGVNLFSGAQPTRMIRLLDLATGLLGERCTGVTAIPRRPKQDPSTDGLPVEVLLSGETRLVVVHELSSPSPLSARLLGARSKNNARSAITANPRPAMPSSVAFNLSVSRGGSLRLGRQRRLGVRTDIYDNENQATEPLTRTAGLQFATDLSAAADRPGEGDEESRDVEAEMMDIMDIDRELDLLDGERDAGTKHVFFEGL